jgi:putative ABC transport system permease protein
VNGKSVSLLAIDPVIYPRISGLDFLEGDPATAYAALGAEHALIVNGVLASNAGLKEGDSVRLATPDGEQEYRVAAVAGDFFNYKISTAYISQANLLAQFHKSEDVFVQVNLAPGADSNDVKTRLLAIVKDYPQFHLIEGKTYRDDVTQQLQSAYAFLYILLGVLAVPSLIALLNTLAIGVIERTREIGMLRAIGATRSQVQRMIVAESLLLAGIGTAIGLVAGLYLGDVMVVGLSAAGLRIPYAFPAAGLLSAVATGLLFGVLAALLPARQAARLEIIRALRYE